MKAFATAIAIMGMVFAFAPPGAAAATYYVNNSSALCSNTGSGTQASPYCTISAALAAHHGSGTMIVVLPGKYHEQVTVSASGVSGSPIVLQGQGSPGNPVVVDGADDFAKPALWVQYSGNVWLAASATSKPKQVFADNARLASSTAAPASLPANSFVWVSGAGLYVNVGGGNPGNHLAEVTSRSFNFNVTGCSWVVIDGFTTTRSVWAGVLAINSSNITVTNNVATFGFSYGIQAENCTATVIGSNVTSDNLWSGIALTAGSTGCTIQDNESFRNLTPNQACGIYDYGAPGNLIQRNRLHDNAYNGIFLSAGASNNVLRQNRAWNNAHQGLEDIFSTGNCHVGDVSYNNAWNGFAIEGSATGTTLYNCVAVDNGQSGSTTNLEVDASSTSGFTSNDNLFWNSSGRSVVQFGGTSYTSVSAYSAATGKDTRSRQANPKFANATGGDFRPTAGSPLIDNANSGVANWPSTDADGNARVDDPATANTGLGPVSYADRGALEYQPVGIPNQPPVAKLVLAPSSGIAPLAVSADASGSLDPEGGRIASYRFDFGDGTVVGPQPGATAPHTYSAAGTWLASVVVTDSVGGTATASAADTVRNSAPVAALKLTPSSGLAPLAVIADASGSTSSARITSYRFNFGDGTVTGPQSGATAPHTYSAAGTWLASVVVTDSVGGTATASAADTVRSAPVAVLKVTPASGFAPLPVIADGSGSSASVRIVTYSFNFGDGTPVVPQSGKTATHTYATGNWTASLTVTDSLGGVGTTSLVVPVAPTPPPPNGTYYVDGSSGTCSPTGPGTQASPFCTITAALTAQHAGGTTIVVMPGIYREQVTLPASGTSGNPIVLQAQASPGNPVIVDGADDFANPALWTLSSGTVWLASSVTWSPKQVLADSVRLAVSTAVPASLPSNSFVWVSGQGLYVNLGGNNPGNHHAEVGRRTYGFYLSGRSWVVVDGFTTTRTEAVGVEVTNLSNNVNVTHNVATFSNNYGFQVNNCSAVLIGSNVASDNLWSGIAMTAGATGCTIQDNESFRNLTLSQSCGIYDYGAPANLIQRNRLHDNAYTGIKLGGGAINNVLIQNQAWKNGHYGLHDLSSAGNAHVGDVAYGNVSYGFAIEGSATGTTMFDCVSTENGGADLLVDATSTPGFASNDNLFWNSVAGTLVKFGGMSYSTVPAYSAASSQDTRTFQADPKFANAAGGDFHPTSGSPLIDAANSGVVNWPSTDATGNARVDDPATANTGLGPVAYADRGAFEFQAGAPAAARAASAVHAGAGAPTDSSIEAAFMRVGGLAPTVAPNPVRTSARLAFRLERPAPVRIRIFDLGGRLVRTLPGASGTTAGWNVVDLDGRADNGAPLRSGVYLYEIRAGEQRAVGRFVVMR